MGIISQFLGRDGDSVSVVSNCTMGMFWGRYDFFHWLLRGFTGNWVKTVPYYNSAQPRPSPTQTLKMVVRIRPVKVYFCSFFHISLSISCYPKRKTMKTMINNVVSLFSATNEETQYPFPCIATRTFQGPVSQKSRGNYRARNDVLFAFKTDVLICLNVKQEDYQFAKQNALVRG